MGEWDKSLEEYVIGTGGIAAGLAQASDGVIYAAAPQKDEAGWAAIFKEPHEEDILQEDGETTKKMLIDESKGLKHVVETGSAPEGGFWLGGKKYQITRRELDYEEGDYKYVWISAGAPGDKGAQIVKSGSQIVVSLFDKEAGVSPGNCKKAVLDFGKYLQDEGY